MALKELDEILLLAVLCQGGREVPFKQILLAVEHRTGIALPRATAGRALTQLASRGLISVGLRAPDPQRRRPRKVYSLLEPGLVHLRRVLGRLRAMSRGVPRALV